MTKVYVSSTFLDLKECREKVRLVLRRMELQDVAMEYYVAGEKRPVDKCLADVAACDLYVGVFAWRHGFVPKTNNRRKMSVTEMEYRKAVETNKPRLIFLLDEEASWPVKFIDDDKKRIRKLRAELEADNFVSHFKSAAELGEVLAPAVHNWLRENGHITPVARPAELSLDAYYAALLKRYQRIDLNALTPPEKEEYLQLQLRQVFVAQSVRENPPPVELPKELWDRLRREGELHDEDLPEGVAPEEVLRARTGYYEKTAQPVIEVIAEARHKHLIVLGDPGAGKSTLARYVLLSLISEEGDERLRRAFAGHVPLLVELRSYAGLYAEGRCESFTEFLAAMGRSEGWGLEREALEHYLKAKPALVIFDGLDEIFDPEQREQIARRIVGFTNEYPQARLLVTSRVVGYRRKILADAGFAHFTLQDLDEGQVSEFVTRWYDLALSDRPEEAAARRERILRAFRDSASIRQLAGNPMLLTIMAIIGKHRELPRERWKLYDHAAGVLVEHWDIGKHLKDRRIDAPYIEEEDKKELLRRLAFKMQAGAGGLAGNYIHRDELQAEFEGYLKDRYKLQPAEATPVARTMIDQFRERNFILSLYGAQVYGFVHRAFLEYFCATAFVHKFEKTREITPDRLKREVYGAHYADRSWHEVLRLICGILDEKFAGEIIDFLATGIEPPAEGWTDEHLPWNIALAVQCLSEVRNLGTVSGPAGRLLRKVCALLEIIMKSYYDLIGFMDDPVAASVETIGSNWPQKSALVAWLKQLSPGYNAWAYAEAFGRIVGSIGTGINEVRQIILSYAASTEESHRVLAPHTLAVGWHEDDATRPLLHSLAVEDASADVRGAALGALARHYQENKAILALLQEGANDEDWYVRLVVLSALVSYYRDNAATLPLLREHAVNDQNSTVRMVALQELARHYPENQATLSLLRTRAKGDNSERVRNVAQDCIAKLEGAQTI